MTDRSVIRKQQLRFVLMNLLSFTVIFTLFGIIIFSAVRTTLYEKADDELESFRAMMAGNTAGTPFEGPPPRQGGMDRNRPNPRVIEIRWSADGRILNPQQLGTQLSESTFSGYTPDFTTLDTITDAVIGDNYRFRTLLEETVPETGDPYYTQLLINTDAEQTILENFGRLLILCSALFVVLSIAASFLLSKRMMRPIIQSWQRQTEFVENASHELRTPLTIIQNKLEMLLRAPQKTIADKFENIALSLSETRRLTKLTADLMTLARADSAETALEKTVFSAAGFIRTVSRPYAEIAESEGKSFTLKLPDTLELSADEVRFHQLLVILLDNSLKYTSEGDRIGVKLTETAQSAVLEVADTGFGIQAGNEKRIFERFYREDRARSRETGGSGLGLSLAQWIAEAHGGTIRAAVNPDGGTVMTVVLPKRA